MNPITTQAEFLSSLREPQLRYYHQHVADLEDRLQAALRQLALGMGTVSALHEEALHQVQATRATR